MFLCVKNNCIQTVEINLIIMEQKVARSTIEYRKQCAQ